MRAGARVPRVRRAVCLFRWCGRFLSLVVAGASVAWLDAAPQAGPLRVALLAGAEQPGEAAEQSLRKLKAFLESAYPIEGGLILSLLNSAEFSDVSAWRAAEVGVFIVGRTTLSPRDLAALKKFCDSGRGVVALGAHGRGWANWPGFDLEILGAKYEGAYRDGKPAVETRLRAHPILAGAEDFRADGPLDRYTSLAPGVCVIMEAGGEGKFTPIAWTRERKENRVCFLGPAQGAEFDQPAYLRLIANGIMWAARREIAGVGPRINRTWMPDAFPSSFAVGFSNGLNFCFDPVRGCLAYAWEGDYLDLYPTIAGVASREATLNYEPFYRTAPTDGFQPDSPADQLNIRFKGYSVKEGVPQFRYEIGGLNVRETIAPIAGRGGLQRFFHVESGGAVQWFRPGDPGRVTVAKGEMEWVAGRLRIPPRATVEFSEAIPRL